MKVITYFFIVSFMVCIRVHGTEKSPSLKTVKENVKNSKINLSLLRKNQKVVKANVAVLDQALLRISKMKSQLKNSADNADEYKANLQKKKNQLHQFVELEMQRNKASDQLIVKLEEEIRKARENKQKRLENVKAYQTRIEEILREEKDWQEQKDKAEEIKSIIAKKEAEAFSEKKKWIVKDKSYIKRIKKWKKNYKKSKENLEKYSYIEKTK